MFGHNFTHQLFHAIKRPSQPLYYYSSRLTKHNTLRQSIATNCNNSNHKYAGLNYTSTTFQQFKLIEMNTVAVRLSISIKRICFLESECTTSSSWSSLLCTNGVHNQRASVCTAVLLAFDDGTTSTSEQMMYGEWHFNE